MDVQLSQTDRIVRDIVAALPPRPPCVELVDPEMVPILRSKTASERQEIANGMWRAARSLIASALRAQQPEWTPEQIQREVVRRMSHGLV